MPPASTRAALNAVAPAPAMASLASSFGTLHIASSRRAAVASATSFSPSSLSSPSSSPFSTAASSYSRCCRRQAPSLLALSASRRPLLASSTSSRTLPSTIPTPSSSAAAAFSTTPACASRAKRRRMRQWIKDKARPLFWPKSNEDASEQIHYGRESAKAKPMPYNDTFKSEPVLDEPMRNRVWSKVMTNGESIKGVAASMSIDMRRVAAVVRLKEIENQWRQQGKRLATPYSKAVLGMLPTYGSSEQSQGVPFENINEIHTHAYTKQQLFVPVSESRHFTREDAARAFHANMLSPDKRMPIPELIQVEKDVVSGKLSYDQSLEQFQVKAEQEQVALAEKDRAAAQAEEARTTRVATDRFEFRIKDINADNVGPHGRSPHAVGWRYGVPFHDRKRGQVKIPTSVG